MRLTTHERNPLIASFSLDKPPLTLLARRPQRNGGHPDADGNNSSPKMEYTWRVKGKDSGSSGSEAPSRNASVHGRTLAGMANGNASVHNGRKPPAGSNRGALGSL